MKVWITTVGKSPFAVVNPIWMVCRKGKFIPNRVYLVWNEEVEEVKKTVERMLGIILQNYGVPELKIIADESVKVREDDFNKFKSVISEICNKELNEGNEVVIDMTPGRKFMSALAMVLGLLKKISVYYLHLTDLSYQNKSLVLIPFSIQKLYDMKEELYEGRKM